MLLLTYCSARGLQAADAALSVSYPCLSILPLSPGCRIDNPDYKGIWVAPDIDNPEYKHDDNLYLLKDLKYLGFELWQVKSGSIFDNVIVTDNLEEAIKFGEATWGAIKDQEKEAFDKIKEVSSPPACLAAWLPIKWQCVSDLQKHDSTIEACPLRDIRPRPLSYVAPCSLAAQMSRQAAAQGVAQAVPDTQFWGPWAHNFQAPPWLQRQMSHCIKLDALVVPGTPTTVSFVLATSSLPTVVKLLVCACCRPG